MPAGKAATARHSMPLSPLTQNSKCGEKAFFGRAFLFRRFGFRCSGSLVGASSGVSARAGTSDIPDARRWRRAKDWTPPGSRCVLCTLIGPLRMTSAHTHDMQGVPRLDFGFDFSDILGSVADVQRQREAELQADIARRAETIARVRRWGLVPAPMLSRGAHFMLHFVCCMDSPDCSRAHGRTAISRRYFSRRPQRHCRSVWVRVTSALLFVDGNFLGRLPHAAPPPPPPPPFVRIQQGTPA